MTECVNEQFHFLKSDFLHGIRANGFKSQFNRVILKKKFSRCFLKFQKIVRCFLQLIFGCKLFSMMNIRYEDQLDGVSNYIPWKVRITIVLKELRVWSFINSVMTKPTNKDELEVFEAHEAKAQRIILDWVKDHLIPHLAKKKTTKDMWDTLTKLFEAKNENRKMALKDKLHSIKMKNDEGVASYLTRVTQVKDELAAVGETIPDLELVRIALKGFTKKWEVFVKCIVGRETLPSWFRLWDDFTQDEIRDGS